MCHTCRGAGVYRDEHCNWVTCACESEQRMLDRYEGEVLSSDVEVAAWESLCESERLCIAQEYDLSK